MEGVNCDRPKILEIIFLSKFFICRFRCVVKTIQNLKEIGSPQTKQCINAYRKKSKLEKRAANNKQNNEQQNEQNRKNKKPSRLSSLDVSKFMVDNNIKSETELFAIADEQKKYLEDGVWKQKKFFAQNKPLHISVLQSLFLVETGSTG